MLSSSISAQLCVVINGSPGLGSPFAEHMVEAMQLGMELIDETGRPGSPRGAPAGEAFVADLEKESWADGTGSRPGRGAVVRRNRAR